MMNTMVHGTLYKVQYDKMFTNLGIRSSVTDLRLCLASIGALTIYTLVVRLSSGVCSTPVLPVLSLQGYLDPDGSGGVTLCSALFFRSFQFLLLLLLLSLQQGESFLQFSFTVVVALSLLGWIRCTSSTASRFVFLSKYLVLVRNSVCCRFPVVNFVKHVVGTTGKAVKVITLYAYYLGFGRQGEYILYK